MTSAFLSEPARPSTARTVRTTDHSKHGHRLLSRTTRSYTAVKTGKGNVWVVGKVEARALGTVK